MSAWTTWPATFTLSQTSDFSSAFPKLHPRNCTGDVSPATRAYNCFAWAASVADTRWEPDQWYQYYWPDSAPREYTLNAFIEAYQTIGFERCEDDRLEPGMEKIAIYTISDEPQHAARQLADGNWTTKFGHAEDVEHLDLECLEGPGYGRATHYLKRVRQ